MKACYQLFLLFLLVLPSFADRVYVIEGNNALAGEEADWVVLENGSSDPGAQNATSFGARDFNFSFFKEYRIRNTGSESVTFNDGKSDQSQFKLYQTETAEEINFPLTLASEEEFAFSVRFIPRTREEVTARIRFRSANAKRDLNEYDFRIAGSGTGGEILVEGRGGADLDFLAISSELNSTFLRENGTLFQPTNANSSRSHEFSISNTTEGLGEPVVKDSLRISEAILTGRHSSQFEIIGITEAIALGGDNDDLQQFPFQIQYNPTSEGTHSATLEIYTNDLEADPFRFQVRGISPPLTDFAITGRPAGSGLGEFLQVFSAGVDDIEPAAGNGTLFSTTSVGNLSETVVELENSGREGLLVNSITIEGEFADQFRLTEIPGTVSVESASTFGIVFEPTSDGLKTATITIDTNDSDEGVFSFLIGGKAEAPMILFSGQTDYGEVGLGKTATESFLLFNNGSENLIVSNASIVDAEDKDLPEWSIPSQVFPVTIEPGEFMNLDISYAPNNIDDDPVSLILESNDPLENVLSIDLTGEAILEAELSVFGITEEGAVLAIEDGDDAANQTVTDFGPVELDQTSTKTFRILSRGTKELSIASISSSHPAFVVAADPEMVTSGDHLEFTVTYTPGIVEDEVTIITIESDGIGASDFYSFSLKGTGTGPKLALYGGLVSDEGLIPSNELTTLTGNLTDFGLYRIGSSPILLPLIVKNLGDRELTISEISSFHPQFEALLESSEFPINLGPAEERVIEFTFAADRVQEAISIVVFETNDRSLTGGSYPFAVRASVETAVPEAPELAVSVSENQQVPSTSSPSEVVDLWYPVEASGSETVFTLSNSGDTDLIVRAVTSSNPNFKLDFIPASIAPGASGIFSVSNDTATEPGAEETILKIYSSSATSSIYTLNIRTNYVRMPEITAFNVNQEGELTVALSDSFKGFNVTTATDLEALNWETLDPENISVLADPDRVNLGVLSAIFPEDKRRFFRLELKKAGQ